MPAHDEQAPDDDLPIDPVIRQWMAEYAAAGERDREAVVVRMLEDWNRSLILARRPVGPRPGSPRVIGRRNIRKAAWHMAARIVGRAFR